MSDWRKIDYGSEYMRGVRKYAIKNNIKSIFDALAGYKKMKPRPQLRGGNSETKGCAFHTKSTDCVLYPSECGEGYKKIVGGGGCGGGKKQKGCSKRKTMQKGCSHYAAQRRRSLGGVHSKKGGGKDDKICMTDQEYLFSIAAAQIASETKGKKLDKRDLRMLIDERLSELRKKRDPYHQVHYDYIGPLIDEEDEDLFSAEESDKESDEESDEEEKRKKEEKKRRKLRKKIKKVSEKKAKLEDKLRKSYEHDDDDDDDDD